MKTRKNILVGVLIFGIFFVLSGCGKKESAKYGRPIGEGDPTQIKEVLKDPKAFSGKTIIIEGKIVRECHTGCWFDVEGAGGSIYVDIKPSGFAIPQKVGKEVIVEGDVSLRDGQLTFIGKGVEIK